MARSHRALDRRRWAVVRRRVLERDGWRCKRCGRAGRLEVDHTEPLKADGDPYDEANLQTLCRGCHIDKTAGENRRPLSPTEQEWADEVARTVAAMEASPTSS